MGIDDTEQRQSNLMIGILIISVIAIFMGFALVIGGSEIYSQEDILLSDVRISNNTEINAFNENTDVSVGKGGCIYGIPTAAGEISASSWYFPALEWTELPLCISDADIASWYIDLYVKGGYEPTCGCISLTQLGVEQKIYINWVETEYDCYSIWTAHFTTDDGLIKFESSQGPVINLPFDYDYCGDGFADKLVDMCWCTGWIGCDFCILLIHKSVFGVPQLPMNYLVSLSVCLHD